MKFRFSIDGCWLLPLIDNKQTDEVSMAGGSFQCRIVYLLLLSTVVVSGFQPWSPPRKISDLAPKRSIRRCATVNRPPRPYWTSLRAGAENPSNDEVSVWSKVGKFAGKNFFLVGLFFAVMTARLFPKVSPYPPFRMKSYLSILIYSFENASDWSGWWSS